MSKPAWENICPGCGRPFVVYTDEQHPLPDGQDRDVWNMLDWEGTCSACDLRIYWFVDNVMFRYGTRDKIKVPELAVTGKGTD
ncbi:MAG: hypothetical protein IIA89_07605 [Chloroflexi bacterium]|nr:hypothetical protein [Chloroflexota bacterium]